MFRNNELAKDYLIQNRKSEAISSYLTEYYFERRYLQNINYTQGWYLDCQDEGLNFYVQKQVLNETDISFANQPNILMWQVYFDADDEIILKRYGTNVAIRVEDYVQNNHLVERHRRPLEHEDVEEQERRNEYCNRLIADGKIIDVANKVYIENAFLNKYFGISDIDFIVKNDLGYIALEVKYKYPSRNGCYGINVGPFSVFNRMEQYGIRVFNIILKNQNRMDCLDYIAQDNPVVEYAYVDTGRNYPVRNSPVACAYFEDGIQQYRAIPCTEYRRFNDRGNIIDMRCPLCGDGMVLRNTQYGELLGCKTFPWTGCRGKIHLSNRIGE